MGFPNNPRRDPNDSWGRRLDFLELPPNDRVRRAVGAWQAQLGTANEATEAGRRIFNDLLTAVGSIGGFLGLGPAGVLVGSLVGAVASAFVDHSVKVRFLTDKEWSVALRVFGSSLPPRESIILTDIKGLNGRPFTVPGSKLAQFMAFIANPFLLLHESIHENRILINFGDKFAAPASHTLIHELTHVWQIRHSSFVVGLFCDEIVTQLENFFRDVYKPDIGKPWAEQNAEQQAKLIELWYLNDCKVTDPLYPYARIVNKDLPAPPPSPQPTTPRRPAPKRKNEDGERTNPHVFRGKPGHEVD